MNNESKSSAGYKTIDTFRIIAALLVIAIHTSPLESVNETADFVFTRIIARIAVVFFFTTTGYFLFYRNIKINSMIKKLLILYATAVIIYIPVNIYKDDFSKSYLILKKLIFDGTIYHLWYFPAVIIGSMIVYFLNKKIGIKKTFIITLILYIIGLFGDSYYGLIKGNIIFSDIYDMIFIFSSYTRNGIFFAPIYISLGGMIAQYNISNHLGGDRSEKRANIRNIAGLIISLLLFLIEGMLLHNAKAQRHDSMYISLIFVTYFFFLILLHYNEGRNKKASGLSMWMYILHPYVILIINIAFGILGFGDMWQKYSLFKYVVVCIVTIPVAYLADLIYEKAVKKISTK